LELPYDALAQIISNLTFKDQLALRRVCRQTRDLTAGAMMVARLARVPFFEPQTGRRDIQSIFVPRNAKPCAGFIWDCRRDHPGKREICRSACIKAAGFEHSTRLAVEVIAKSLTCTQAGSRRAGVEAVWEEGDKLRFRFEVTAEGDVPTVKVVFQRGCAQRRAVLLGRVLGEVLKRVDFRKAQLFTRAFARCESAHAGDVVHLGTGMYAVFGLEPSCAERGVRVALHPLEGTDNMHLELSTCVMSDVM
jgi:hypothetical protein